MIESVHERRSFLSRLKFGAAATAAFAIGSQAVAKPKAPPRFEPARHPQDDWMDQIPGVHRLVLDTVSNEAMGEALLFATNYMMADRDSYGLKDSDLAIIVVARHRSTALAYNDAMWAKYGPQIAPLTGVPAGKTNPRNAGSNGVSALGGQGVHFAVCGMASGFLAQMIAQASGSTTEAVTAELTANLVPNAHMTPAGIVAVSRAQERGYTLVTA